MRGLLQAIGRLCLRNEDAINMIAQDTRLVMFCGAGGTGLPASLYKVAQAWKDRKEAGTATLSLRVTLLMAVFKETLLRCQAIHKSTEDPQQAKDQEIMTAQGDWPYLLWDSANQRHAHNENRTALKPAEVEADILRLIALLPLPGVFHRFHSLRPLAPAPEAPVIPFILDVGLRTQEAQEAYHIFLRLSQNAVTQLAAFNMPPDRLGRSALAKRVQTQLGRR